MYDDTVAYATNDTATFPLASMVAPKIEPGIVFRVARPAALTGDAASVLEGVEWLALGYEVIDCVYHDWKFQPVDFVAAKVLHAALVVGTPLQVTDRNRAELEPS